MERKVKNDGRILETACNIIEQVNTLLVSAANPSDETSLSIRLSLIKVCSHIFGTSFFIILLELTRAIIDAIKQFIISIFVSSIYTNF